MSENSKPPVAPKPQTSHPAPFSAQPLLRDNARYWIVSLLICSLGALIGYRGARAMGNDKLQNWQAITIIGAALLAGVATASKNWSEGIRLAVIIVLFGGGSRFFVWATGGWEGGWQAAVIGALVGAAYYGIIFLIPLMLSSRSSRS